MLPRDPMILFSVVNTKLRDQYSSMEELLRDMDEDEAEITGILTKAGFRYDKEHNLWRPGMQS